MAPTPSLSCRVVTTAAATVTRAGTRVHSYLAGALSRRWVCDTVVTLAYVGITVLFFHKLMLHIGDSVLFEPNDESAGIRLYWGAEFQGENPFTQRRDTLNGAPEGLPLASAVNIANAVIPGTIWLLHYAVGLTAAANVFLLGGFVLTGVSFYVLFEPTWLSPVGKFRGRVCARVQPVDDGTSGRGAPRFHASVDLPDRRRAVVAPVPSPNHLVRGARGARARPGLLHQLLLRPDGRPRRGGLLDRRLRASEGLARPALVLHPRRHRHRHVPDRVPAGADRVGAAEAYGRRGCLQRAPAPSESRCGFGVVRPPVVPTSLAEWNHTPLHGPFRVRLVREHPLSGLVVAVARARRSVVGDSAAPRHVRHPGETVLPRLHGGARTGRLPRLAQARNERLRRRRADAVVPGRGVHDVLARLRAVWTPCHVCARGSRSLRPHACDPALSLRPRRCDDGLRDPRFRVLQRHPAASSALPRRPTRLGSSGYPPTAGSLPTTRCQPTTQPPCVCSPIRSSSRSTTRSRSS